MILHSVYVENYKGIRGPCQVEFNPDSPNLLEGPNGAGKSTLVEAIQRCLLESHNTAGESAEEMRPHETALAPTISVVFSHAAYVYRITKTFLDSPKALLERKRADGGYDGIAKGKTADEQVRDMVRGQASRSKERPGERMGLLAVLCSPQGKQDLPTLSGDALTDIRRMLGAEIAGSAGAEFEKIVNKKHALAWTPGGKPKKGKLSDAQAALLKANEDAASCHDLMEQVADLESAARAERSHSQSIQEALRAARAEHASVDALAQQVLGLRTRRTPAVSRIDAANARYNQLRAEIDRITGLRAKKGSLEEIQPQLQKNEAEAKVRLATHAAEVAAAQEDLDRACQPDPGIQQLDDRVEAAAEFVRLEQERGSLRARIERAALAAKRRDALVSETRALNAPEPATWKAIQTAGRSFDEAAMRLESLALRLELTAETGLTVNVASGEPGGETRIGARETFSASGEGCLRVALPGIAAIRVTGPSGDAAEWRVKQETAATSLRTLLAPFGVSAWQELEDRMDARERLAPDLASAKAEYAAALGSDRLEDLQERERNLSARYQEITTSAPFWLSEPPDAALLRAAGAALKAQSEAAQKQARAGWQGAERLRSTAEAAAQSAAEAGSANAIALEETKRTLAELEADGATITERQEQLADRRRECESAAEALREIDHSLAGLPADAPERAEAIHGHITGLESQIQAARETYMQNEAAASAILLRGPYTDLAAAEERVRQLERDEAAETLRLNAIQKLKAAIDEAKAKALDGIAEPVEARATALLERISGRPLAHVQLGDGMALRAVLPEGSTGETLVDRMSAGEQEQIYFATRLALAEVLSEKERQVLVLDDPLVNTDTARLARVLELVSEKSARLQFIILTCHPGRYIELPKAVSRSMEQLTANLAGAGEAR